MPPTRLTLLVSVLLFTGCASTGHTARLTEWQRQAAQGDPTAQFQLGAAHDAGRGVVENDASAATWYRQAAEQGHAEAQNSLGSLYHHGEGVPQDNAQAAHWYQQAAAQGHSEASTNLGYMYDFGFGVPEDKSRAVTLYRRGAETGSLNGMLNLGVAYWEGNGVAKDLIEAYLWLNHARFLTQRSSDMRLKWRVRSVLDKVKKEMTPDQLRTAKARARTWIAKGQP